jgi:predicted nucleotidyltransferase
MHSQSKIHIKLADKIANEFKTCENVVAIAVGGSIATESVDTLSDIDLYVYTNSMVPLSSRQNICTKTGGVHENLNLTFWDLGDEWIDSQTWST